MLSSRLSTKLIAITGLLLLLTGTVITALGCGSGQAQGTGQQQTLTVSAAISLKDVFTELGQDYQAAHPGVEVKFNFGASGDLEQQIIGGAPVDIFASASSKETDELGQQGRIDKSTLIQPVTNDVVLVVPAASANQATTFTDLAQGRFGKIAIGNPDTVPAGRYARDVLTRSGVWDTVKPRLIYGESVRQVLDYVARDEVDAGIVYATDARTRTADVKVLLTAPAASHKPVVYPMAVVTSSQQASLARQFLAYLGSSEALPVFEKYGFRSP